MPILTVTEYTHMQSDYHSYGVVPHARSIVARQSLFISSLSTPSMPFSLKTTFVRVNTDVACNLAYSLYSGEVPVANTQFHRLGPNETEHQGVTPGDMVAVILSPDTGPIGGGGGGVSWTPNFVLIDTSTGPQVYPLPTSPTNGEEVIVKDNGHATSNNITVQGGPYTIDGQPTFMMRQNWSSYGFWFTNSQWYVV